MDAVQAVREHTRYARGKSVDLGDIVATLVESCTRRRTEGVYSSCEAW